MRVISIINLKGGVGKTFTAAQMADILKRCGASVLMVDNDKQGNLSKLYKTYNNEEQCGTAQLLYGNKTANEVVKRFAGVDLIDANMSLLKASWDLNREDTAEQCERFKSIKEATDESGKPYDFVIIDNPPDLGINVINALVITDDVIVPTKIDAWALEGLDIIMEQIEEAKQINPKIKFAGALVTMYQNNDTNVSGMEWLKENGYKVFNNVIRYSEKAAESTFFYQTIMDYSPRSAAARSYRKFIAEYLEMVKGE